MDETVPPKPPPRRRKTAADAGAPNTAPPAAPRRRVTRAAPSGAEAGSGEAPRPPPRGARASSATPRTPGTTESAPARPTTPARAAAPIAPPPPPRARSAAPPREPGPSAAPKPTPPPPRTPAPPAETAQTLPSFLRPATPPPRTAAAAGNDPRPADTSPRSRRAIDRLIGLLPPQHRARALNYLVLMRMDRPVGALLLLWPTWWALWFASNDFPSPGLLIIFTLGVFVMRSAGCVINDYADHEWLDAHVERTRGRPMAAGRVTRREALSLFGALLALAFVLVLFTNRLTIELSFVGAALAAAYPFTKRVTHLAQVVLGAAFGWSIPMAFAAVTGSLPPLCWLLFLANVLFSTIYDTEYAMVDREDDIRVGAKSTAILFADADRAIIGVLMATFVLAMLLAGTRVALRWPYYAGVVAAAGLFAWQQWTIRDRSRAHCFAAFRNNNWVGLALWVGLVLALAIR